MAWLADLIAADPPRAPGFIVTIYGDVVDPRGGALWVGTLIDCCAAHGLSETLVRTAVSRLVGAGRLIGERIGRRSYYRLTGLAQAEFRAASATLYARPPEAQGWLLALRDEAARDADWPPGWARLSAEAAMAPNRPDVEAPGGLVMTAVCHSKGGDPRGFAARHWPVREVARAYEGFVAKYGPVAHGLAGAGLTGPSALALRLRLVHDYRASALSDPRLPAAALPADWPGEAAYRIFARVYLALAGAADAHIGDSFRDSRGSLGCETRETARRLATLHQGLHANL